MVRTAATGFRVSAGKSSKKVGGGASTSSNLSATKSGGTSTKLPPIPHQETPSWQKPITNFFKSNSPLKQKENKTEQNQDNINEDKAGSSKKKIKFDNEEITQSENPTEDRAENDASTTKEDKGNDLKNTMGFKEGAGTSKN